MDILRKILIYLQINNMKFDSTLRKKIILLIFFFMPGGFILLAILLSLDEFIFKNKTDVINTK